MSGNKKKREFPKVSKYTYGTAILCAAALWTVVLPLAAQSKSPTYAASGAFTTATDNYMNPAGFQNIKFDTIFAFTGIGSRYLDLGVASRFGRIYTALSYSGNVFDYTGFNLMGLNIIKPAKPPFKPNNEPGNLKNPAFSNKGTILIGISNTALPLFKNLGFKVSLETVSKKHIKQELYDTSVLTVQPKNPENPIIFEFKDGSGNIVKAEGTDKSSLKMVFDWSGFHFPIKKHTFNVKPYIAADLNKNITKAETNKASSYTEGFSDQGNTELKFFLNIGYGEFNVGYSFFYKFFPDMPEKFVYTGTKENSGTQIQISTKQTTEQKGRSDMLHKINPGYKPTFKLAKNTLILKPGVIVPFEIRTTLIPYTLKTTETVAIKTGTTNEVVKKYIKEYGTYTKETRITVSPAVSAGLQYRIIKDVLTLNAGTIIQMTYTHSTKNIRAPEIGKVTAIMQVDNSGTETHTKTTENSKVADAKHLKDEFGVKGFFGIGLQWNINSVLSFDSAYTVNTDFKNAEATREKSSLNVCLCIKL